MENLLAIDTMGKDTFSMFSKPALLETCADVIVTMVPLWMAILIGLVVGWAWKPRWVSFVVLGLRTRPRLVWSTPPGLGTRRLWIALTAITAFPFLKEMWSKFRSWMWPRFKTESNDVRLQDESVNAVSGGSLDWAPTNEDLFKLRDRLDEVDGGAEWNLMMDHSFGEMTYQAWRREPLEGSGPTEYRSRTHYEGVTTVEMRDFFWDDEFRREWDDMLISSKTWEECPRTGCMVVQWVRKFPVFCKDREYVISRRMWGDGSTFYCLTKGAHYPQIQRRAAPRRVDVFYSSWRIRSVESRKGYPCACEVTLFHHEDMGIQRDLAKLGIRQGMWPCVKKMEPGLRKYRELRMQGKPQSRCAVMAGITTKLPANFVRTSASVESTNSDDEVVNKGVVRGRSRGGHLRWFILGGAVALACGVDKGAVGKVLVFGIARRLGRKSKSVKY